MRSVIASSESTATRQPGAISLVSGRWPGSFPALVWLIVGLQAIVMLGLTIVYPAFQNPDEAAHVDYVIAYRHGEWLDGPGQRHYQSGVLAAASEVPEMRNHEHVGGQRVVPRGERKSFDQLGTAPDLATLPDQMVQHPPLYYAVAAGWSYVLPGWNSDGFDVQIFWLRLLSVLLLAPVPLLIYGAVRRLSGQVSVALVAAVIPLSIPSYVRTGAAVNNDALLTLLVTVLVALLVRISCGDLSRRTAAFAGIAWGAALLTKGFALALPPAILLAYLVGAPNRGRRRVALPPFIVTMVVGCVIGLWWWVRNLVVYGTVQPNGYGTLPEGLRRQFFGAGHPGGTELGFFKNFFQLLAQRLWGSIGIIDSPSPPHAFLYLLAALLLATLTFAVLLGMRRFRPLTTRGLGSWTLGRATTLLLPAVLILAVMIAGSRSAYLEDGQLPGIQVRYLVPTLIGVTICCAVTLRAVAGRLARWLPFTAALLALLYLAAWISSVLAIDMSPPGEGRLQSLEDGARYVAAWAPFPGWVTATLLVLAAIVAAATLVALARQARHPAGDEAPSGFDAAAM